MLIGGIVMIVAGALTAGGITWWAIWAAGKLGPGVWTSAKSLPLIIVFWAGGAAMTIGGIFMIAKDHPEPHQPGKHGRLPIATELRRA
jgi:hypothetical protein